MKIFSRNTLVLTLANLCNLLGWASNNPVYDASTKPIKAVVNVLALSSVGRQAYAGNQDTYIAEIVIGHGATRLVKLVDRYPVYGYPIRHSILVDRRALRMRLLREDACDVSAAYVHTPLNEEDLFDKKLGSLLEAQGSETLHCYSVDHAATRLQPVMKLP